MTVLMFRHLQTCWCNCMIILQNAERCFSTHNYTIVHSDKHISKAFKLIIKPSLLRCVRFKAGLSACVRETEVFMLLRNTIKPHNKNNVFGHEEADGLDESSSFVFYFSLQWSWPRPQHAGLCGKREGYWSWQEPSNAARGDLLWLTWCMDATADWVVKAGPETGQTGEL